MNILDCKVEDVRSFVRCSALFSDAALVMADFALRCAPGSTGLFYLTVALTVNSNQANHVCCKLSKYAGTELVALNSDCSFGTLRLPDVQTWREALRQDPAVGHCIAFYPQEKTHSALLVFDPDDGCYLQRQWHFEQSIVRALISRARSVYDLPILPEKFLHSLVKFFPDAVKHPAVDHQQLALLAALRHKLLVISGGPGTGKTTVASAILALKLKFAPQMKILLAAPTAKAAIRLKESLIGNLDNLQQVSDSTRAALQELPAVTINRLLGTDRKSHEFKRNQENPLECDLLLVDECSMVSQHLMARMLEALPESADLILLGDRYQLASVEAGSVIGDICQAAQPNVPDAETAKLFKEQTNWDVPVFSEDDLQKYPLNGCLVELTENHRFDTAAPGIGRSAALIRNLDNSSDFAAAAAEISNIKDGGFEFIRHEQINIEKFIAAKLAIPRLASGESMLDLLRLAGENTPESRNKAFALLNALKILAPVHHGKIGIDRLNALCMEILQLKDIHSVCMALMISQNDYRVNLFNSDTGIVCRGGNGTKEVWFPGNERAYKISELPEHVPVFAMSVHKSQGSGFSETICVLPEKFNEACSREMIYTAMTRAEKQLCCIGSVEVLTQTLKNVTERMSNLTGQLQRHD